MSDSMQLVPRIHASTCDLETISKQETMENGQMSYLYTIVSQILAKSLRYPIATTCGYRLSSVLFPRNSLCKEKKSVTTNCPKLIESSAK